MDVNKRTSISVSCRVDGQQLGTARRVLGRMGVVPASRSELVARCVELVAMQAKEEDKISLVDALFELDHFYPVATRRGTHVLDKRVSARRRAIIEANEDAWREAGLVARGMPLDREEQAQVGEERKGQNYIEVTSRGNHYLVCKDEETYKEVVGKFGNIEIAKQAGFTILMEGEFDPIARRAKSEAPQEVSQKVLESLGSMVVVGSENQPQEAHK